MGGRHPRNRFHLVRVLAALITYLLIEATAGLGLRVLTRWGLTYQPIRTDRLTADERSTITGYLSGATTYLVPDSVLGWTIAPGGRTPLYHATTQGLRSDRLYGPPPADRIAAFGDSFVHGDEVGNQDTWTAQLERLSGREVLNFGVSAYGLDQAYLRWHTEGRRTKPSVVIIGLYLEDVHRDLNVWRPYYLPGHHMPLAKPRFVFRDSLTLIPNPLTRAGYVQLLKEPETILPLLGAEDYFFRVREPEAVWDASPIVRLAKLVRQVVREQGEGTLSAGQLRAGSEGVRLATALLDRFVGEVRTEGALPLVIVFPNRGTLGKRVEAPIVGDLRRRGVLVVDMADKFVPCACPDRLFVDWHYSSAGNRMVAEAILDALR